MDWKMFVPVFGTVFLAELGDKTQLATLLFASKEPSAIAVVGGAAISNYVDPRILSWIAGVGFILIGIWTIWQA